jgi:hypothetical protein
MFRRSQVVSQPLAINTAGATPAAEFYFPRAVRILRYFDVPNVAQAAHATITVTAVFTNAGTDGAGSTVLATLTNATGTANTTKIKSAAWVAHDALEINTEARPVSAVDTDNADEIAAGSVIKVVITGAGSTPTASVHHIGIEFIESD